MFFLTSYNKPASCVMLNYVFVTLYIDKFTLIVYIFVFDNFLISLFAKHVDFNKLLQRTNKDENVHRFALSAIRG